MWRRAFLHRGTRRLLSSSSALMVSPKAGVLGQWSSRRAQVEMVDSVAVVGELAFGHQSQQIKRQRGIFFIQ